MAGDAMTKLLKERYKTYEGARKRAAFENDLARGEFERGDKAKHSHYVVRIIGDADYRVERSVRNLARDVDAIDSAVQSQPEAYDETIAYDRAPRGQR